MSQTLGKEGIPTGARLARRLEELEKKIEGYPFEYSYSSIGDKKTRGLLATTIGENLAYVECSSELYKIFHHGRVSQGKINYIENPFGANIEEHITSDFEPEDVFKMAAASSEEVANVNEQYVIIGKPVYSKHMDGDTFHVIPEYVGKEAKKQGISNKSTNIRFLGVQTPETHKDGKDQEQYSYERNSVFSKFFSITVDEAFTVAEEAKEETMKQIGVSSGMSEGQLGDFYVLIHLDRDKYGTLKKANGRPLGVVYPTKLKSAQEVLNALRTSGSAFPNLNKVLLTTKSKKFPSAPLGYMEYDDVYSGYNSSVLNPLLWPKELGIRVWDTGKNNKPTGTDVDPEEWDKLKEKEKWFTEFQDGWDTSLDNVTKFGFTDDYIDNALEFLEPNDDRFDEIFYYEDDEKYSRDSRVRIGDVLLTIPPLSIQVNKTSSIQKVKTLRTKSSIMTKAGSSVTTLTMELYFHNLDNINGIPRKTGDYTFYVDGLRSLIAQFSKCPFVPIDNPYVNRILNIHNVGLLDLTVNTVPGFPHSISATITLVKFDSKAYMPDTPYLGDRINYPLMRWFYQQSLFESKPGRRYFQPVEQLTNDFQIFIAKKSALESRVNAMKTLGQMDTPNKVRKEAKEGKNEFGKLLEDAQIVSEVLATYKAYQKTKKSMSEHSVIETGGAISLIKEIYQSKEKLSKEEVENEIKAAKHYYKDIYGKKGVMKENEFYPWESPMFYHKRFGVVPPKTSGDGMVVYDLGNWPTLPDEFEKVELLKKNMKSGYIHIGLGAPESMEGLPTELRSGKKIKGKLGFYVPMTEEYVGKLEKIAGFKADVEEALDEYEAQFDRLKAVVASTEDQLPMEEVKIPSLLPTSLNVVYANEFAPLNVVEGECPTLQYLGSQDPYVQVSFEVNDEGLKELTRMVEKVDEYSRTYRMGITTGFLDIQNPLTRLFGVNSVMIENLTHSTVPNFPGRNQVQMTLVGFNKTQRRVEDLHAFTGGAESDKLADRQQETDNTERQQKDDSIIEMRLRKMEVYPDLELPTYTELNTAIGKMKLNIDYQNRTGALYVDPDFYISTPWTFRGEVNKAYNQPHDLYMKDASGIMMKTSSGSDNMVDADSDTWGALSALSDKAPKVESMFSWGDNSQTSSKDYNGDNKNEPVTYKDPKVGEYITKKGADGKAAYENAPSYEKWTSWTKGSKEQYEKWLNSPNPSEADVYRYIESKAKELFTENSGCAIHVSKYQKDGDPPKPYLRACFNSSAAFAAMRYHDLKDYVPGGRKNELKGRVDAKEFTEPKKNEKQVDKEDYDIVKSRIPQERVISMIKALFHHASRWQQFAGKKPRLDAAKNSAGLTGVPLADVAGSVDEAERILWDWKHNIDIAMKKLFDVYREAIDGDIVKKIEFRTRPWECMIFAYKNGKQPAKDEELAQDGTLNAVLDIFNKHYNRSGRFSTPTNPMNRDIYSEKLELTKDQQKFVKGEATKKDMIKLLNDIGEWAGEKEIKEVEKIAERDGGFWWSMNDFKKASQTYLNSLSESQLKKLIQKCADQAKKDKDWAEKHWILNGIKEAAMWILMPTQIQTKDEKELEKTNEAIVNAVGEAGKEIDNAMHNRLVGNDDPKQLYHEMYTDLRQYDHRGRMLRAFPCFQMLIIDEGRWMSNYKFWDNLYGFNAIESIDVYRSRKIAADTAVIRMTNVYSNLTSRRADIDYDNHSASFWSNLVFERPTEELLEARKELLSSMMLQTGARVHLRMGYGSDAGSLPIVFNGTITEMDSEDVIEVVCQGDGVELGNMVSGDPDDDNNGFFQVTEPRDLICELLTSKGSWFNNYLNRKFDGVFMRDNPLGIMHFGVPGEIAPAGTMTWFNDDYGEAAQNIYSSNGTPTFNQWTHPDGSDRKIIDGWNTWNNMMSTNITRWFQPGDEDNIIVKFYNNTTWDIIQTLTYCSLDYIAAVHPFETRSTLFFGKPYWKMAYGYGIQYEWDEGEKGWLRNVNLENRKPYMQFRFYDSNMDIIKNSVKASEEGVFTNVIVNYDGKQTPILSADFDIRYDKQKTQVVEAEIVARFKGVGYFTSEHQARNFGMSSLRDSLKDMYKGSLTVIGDPAVKPHDAMFMQDNVSTMNGVSLVKAVTHHFSHETGFITSVEPDAYVVNDDTVMMSVGSWFWSAAAGWGAKMVGLAAAMSAVRKVQESRTIAKLVKSGKGNYQKLEEGALRLMLESMDNDIPEFKAYRNAFEEYYRLPKNHPDRAKALEKMNEAAKGIDKYVESNKELWKDEKKAFGRFSAQAKQWKQEYKDMKFLSRKTKAISNGLKAGKAAKGALLGTSITTARAVFSATGIGAIIQVGTTVLTEGLFEAYSRYKEALQCVIMIPLQYRGREFTAGINGHRGMVVGDDPGRLDKLLSSKPFEDDVADGEWGNTMFEVLNFMSGSEKKFSTKQEDLSEE